MQFKWFLLPLFVTVLSGCEHWVGLESCPLIGCQNGLEVELSTQPTTPFRVEAVAPGGISTYQFECTDPSQCGTRVFFPEFTPGVVEIRVITEDRTTTMTYEPRYEERQPNGPDCPPECNVAKVRVEMPSL